MKEKKSPEGYKTDNYFDFREPEKQARDTARRIITDDEVEWLNQATLEVLTNRFRNKFYKVCYHVYEPEDLKQIGYTFYLATINRFNPFKLKGKYLRYKRLSKGLMSSDYTPAKLKERDYQRNQLKKGFEWIYTTYINNFLNEVKRKAKMANAGSSYDYSSAVMDMMLTRLQESPRTPNQEQLLEELNKILNKNPEFADFLRRLSKRTKAESLYKKFKDNYYNFLVKADDLQFQIAEEFNHEVWNNDTYFEYYEKETKRAQQKLKKNLDT